MPDLQISPVAGALGAEILGVDIAQPLDPDTVAAIRQALLDHLVIFFRDQRFEPDSYMRFASYFGKPAEYPLVPGIEGYPEITEVIKLEHERVNFGGIWHADTTYLSEPPMGTMLHALEVPPQGGDTLFANQYLAYESLSESLRKFLDKLVIVNTSAKADVSRTREDVIRHSGSSSPVLDHLSEHPAVRTHPETGRKCLFVNVAHSSHFKGWTEEESAPLLAYLFQHQVRPEFTCRFRWQVGSLAFWDNRAVWHMALNDYHGHRRLMHRITIEGVPLS